MDHFEIVGFGNEVSLGPHHGGELVEDCYGIVSPYSGGEQRDEAETFTEQPEVGIDIGTDPRAPYLHCDAKAIVQSRPVHLTN
jgi:hypothetical protein